MASAAEDTAGPGVVPRLGRGTAVLPGGETLTRTPLACGGVALTLRASAGGERLGAGRGVDRPSVYVAWTPGETRPAQRYVGFQAAEFALPVRADGAALAFDWFAREGFVRAKSVWPLLVFGEVWDGEEGKDGEGVVLIAPVDRFHEQVVVVREGHGDRGLGELRWGWSGDLEEVDEGFETTLVVLQGSGARELMERWGQMVLLRGGGGGADSERRMGCYASEATSRLSYWTDNGAAYWYRKEKGKDMGETIQAAVEALDDAGIEVGCVEFDSWFYEHEVRREFSDVGYISVVPPTGMLRWEPRPEIALVGGVSGLRERARGRPLVLHSRHISSASSYVGEDGLGEWWVDEAQAHPREGDLWERWMAQARAWGAVAYEQDWIVQVWQGVRGLRAAPGRIREWQQQLNRAARGAGAGMALIWCMATPADMCVAAADLSQVAAVRTCDDYRYAEDPSVLWRWHLTTSCMVRALGMWPFKDVFLSGTESSSGNKVDTDGDPNAELEAALSALSAGPVGIGDRAGRANREIAMRTCRSDGVLVKPDVPLALLDQSFHTSSKERPLLWADTTSGAWRYVLVVHAGSKAAPDYDSVDDQPSSGQLPLGNARLVYNWRLRTAMHVDALTVSLRTHEWALFVVCPPPVCPSAMTVIGDVDSYATMGQRRARAEVGNEIVLFGAPGESVCIAAWNPTLGICFRSIRITSEKEEVVVDLSDYSHASWVSSSST